MIKNSLVIVHMAKISVIVLGTIFAFTGAFTEISAAPPELWVVDGMQRVKPDAVAGKGTSIELFAARGEYEPFQIIIRAPKGGLKNVNVLAQDLNGPENKIISKKNITLYREHYIYLKRGSVDRRGSNRPQGGGWYPEPLIPFVDPQSGQDLSGAELDAVPFSLAADKNQPIWVDVFVPREAKAGQYSGIFTVTSQQGDEKVYLKLNVWDFELPLKPSLITSTQLWNVERTRETYIEMLKHRYNPPRVGAEMEREFIDEYGLTAQPVKFWSGRSYGECKPMPPPPLLSKVKAEFNKHQADLLLYAQYADEIHGCPGIFKDAVQWAKRLRAGGVKPYLPTSVVSGLVGDSHENSAADIWSVHPVTYGKHKKNIERVMQRGEAVWSYNTLVQDKYSPKWTIDFRPVDLRIHPGFINQSLNLTGLGYWVSDFWSKDPWNDLCRYADHVPGEGQLIYPGKQVGTKGIAPGMRLKWIREGSEDYEYIEILKSLGREKFAKDIAKQVGPDWRNWTRSTDEIYAARRKLGEEIHRIQTSR